jgi:hypothetical protein
MRNPAFVGRFQRFSRLPRNRERVFERERVLT